MSLIYITIACIKDFLENPLPRTPSGELFHGDNTRQKRIRIIPEQTGSFGSLP
jgi:hypothetical protein